MKKGYFGIGIYETKEKTNIGTLWRSAQNFGADFIFTIGKRYQKQRTDTCDTARNIPLFEFADWKDFIESPMCLNVAVAGSIIMYDRITRK